VCNVMVSFLNTVFNVKSEVCATDVVCSGGCPAGAPCTVNSAYCTGVEEENDFLCDVNAFTIFGQNVVNLKVSQ